MKVVAYLRVSTERQGKSGLGLEAQQAAVEAICRQNGWRILTTYTEVETGRKSDRPELAKAVAHAKRSKAKLVIAKLDRLSRDVAFVSTLFKAGCDFTCCDNPHANKLTIQILAVIAENEADAISARTKAALGAARARGTKLGSARPGHWKGREHLRLAGAKAGAAVAAVAHRVSADAAYCDVAPLVLDLRSQDRTLAQIAAALNEHGQTTRRGKAWNAVQVSRVLARIEKR